MESRRFHTGCFDRICGNSAVAHAERFGSAGAVQREHRRGQEQAAEGGGVVTRRERRVPPVGGIVYF
ncbi:hypothetical protein DIE12_00365 [Burkholderia sp. Bp9015]|nr:hypothetical protein DIE20_00235 [Burkholderia sp. Bp9131]RQR79591.1 hypothetical protein DIE12_00365 [Burkholderia sp. Bp9015]RQS44561.1 hypothetical protein DIE01_03740 [Burkholderia sp. Bp8990]RQS64503.1 hypothetical protein DID98_00065 [Burkholderia sp. Bp8984]